MEINNKTINLYECKAENRNGVRSNGIRRPMPIARMAISSSMLARRRRLAGILGSGRTVADGLRTSRRFNIPLPR